MTSGKTLAKVSIAASVLMLIPAAAFFQGADILVVWLVGSFVSMLAVIGIWFIVGLIVELSPASRKRYREARRLVRAQCMQCGYDLRAHKPGDQCPECGHLVPAQHDGEPADPWEEEDH